MNAYCLLQPLQLHSLYIAAGIGAVSVTMACYLDSDSVFDYFMNHNYSRIDYS